MPKRLVTVVVLTAALLVPQLAAAQKLVFLIRHAERADGDMRTEKDPPLSAAGQARAEKLATMLADSDVRAIYVSEFRRTQDTARPLAARLKLTPQPTPSTDEALVAQLRARYAKDVVLIVGHTNTIPAIISALGGPKITIDESEYDNLFIIVPSTGAMIRVHF